MDSLKLWARDGETVRQTIALGQVAHRETASEVLLPAPRAPGLPGCMPLVVSARVGDRLAPKGP